MTGAEFRDLIVSLTFSLVWPVFAVIILLTLRSGQEGLSSLIETAKYGWPSD